MNNMMLAQLMKDMQVRTGWKYIVLALVSCRRYLTLTALFSFLLSFG